MEILITANEQQKIEQLYAELTPEYWQRRQLLESRQQTSPLSEAERHELINLINQGEDWNVKRLTFLFSLAHRYNKPHDYFLDALGLRHHPLAVRQGRRP